MLCLNKPFDRSGLRAGFAKNLMARRSDETPPVICPETGHQPSAGLHPSSFSFPTQSPRHPRSVPSASCLLRSRWCQTCPSSANLFQPCCWMLPSGRAVKQRAEHRALPRDMCARLAQPRCSSPLPVWGPDLEIPRASYYPTTPSSCCAAASFLLWIKFSGG